MDKDPFSWNERIPINFFFSWFLGSISGRQLDVDSEGRQLDVEGRQMDVEGRQLDVEGRQLYVE